MSNQNGQMVMAFLQHNGRPMTASEMVKNISDVFGANLIQIRPAVLDTLERGVEYGFLIKEHRKYWFSPIDVYQLVNEWEQSCREEFFQMTQNKRRKLLAKKGLRTGRSNVTSKNKFKNVPQDSLKNDSQISLAIPSQFSCKSASQALIQRSKRSTFEEPETTHLLVNISSEKINSRSKPSPQPTKITSNPRPFPQPKKIISNPRPFPQPKKIISKPRPFPQPKKIISKPRPFPQPKIEGPEGASSSAVKPIAKKEMVDATIEPVETIVITDTDNVDSSAQSLSTQRSARRRRQRKRKREAESNDDDVIEIIEIDSDGTIEVHTNSMKKDNKGRTKQ